ncbi:MAG: ectonucleotide pyrophosphatase/phosphodiesterase [Oscillospiraceae bacterium]|jgi:predicted AlkP superfamily pyrophosphatase or phosphodiesterase|nr:ectonucleotide pyrophosphatase/phosphodiesterase [Oscillospiraceae bacterium]
MNKLLIISFDAVSSGEWESMSARYTNIAAFARTASVTLGVQSVFPSNTYPVHCSVATGVHPCDHGVSSNTHPFPTRYPRWITDASAIHARTLWQAASEAGLTVAAVLWPCTGGSPHIRWNIPEIHILPGENQIAANLRSGSKLLQARMVLRYGKLRSGVSQPALDRFVTACSADILRRNRPDLTLVHLSCYDALRHQNPGGSPQLDEAYASLDENLGALLSAIDNDTVVIIFSDHAQLDVHTVLTPNDVLVGMGLLDASDAGYAIGDHRCYIECCGGSAFFHPGSLAPFDTTAVLESIAASEGFSHLLTDEEMRISGRSDLPFGFSAKPGYSYNNVKPGAEPALKGNHGYPLDIAGYDVFYAVRGAGSIPGETRRGGTLLDIAPLARSILGIHT